MALMNDRIRSIGKAEFLNLTPLDINPGISRCEIAVAYEGKNRNGSFISHEEMEDLGRSLRGIPIVGYYSEEKEDFRDHGHRITLDADGMREEILTVPYGFIAPDADVWFQEVEEDTDFGPVRRTYLMCTGYLWSENFPEVRLALDEGRPQSMELSNERLNGHWAEVDEFGMEFFIIERGSTLSKLCILGKDVPPCFEGASVTAPQISKNFSLNVTDDILQRLEQMTEELKFALNAEGGLNSVEDEKNIITDFEEEGGAPAEGSEEQTETNTEEQEQEQENEEQDGGDTPPSGGGLLGGSLGGSWTPGAGGGSDSGGTGGGEGGDGGTGGDDDDDPKPEDQPNQDDLDADDVAGDVRNIRRIYSDEEIDAMEAELAELRQFKAMVEEANKDAVIAKYTMLSDEDKAEVIEHKSEYTAEEIEEKLALVYVRNNVDFNNTLGEDDPDQEANTTFSLSFDSNSEYNVPQMVSALRRTRQNSKR